MEMRDTFLTRNNLMLTTAFHLFVHLPSQLLLAILSTFVDFLFFLLTTTEYDHDTIGNNNGSSTTGTGELLQAYF